MLCVLGAYVLSGCQGLGFWEVEIQEMFIGKLRPFVMTLLQFVLIYINI